jgi:hypothetical protein
VGKAGSPFNGLFDALSFMGQHANACIDRIHIEGLPDPTNSFGFNVVNALHFTGEFPRSLTPWDWYFLSGFLRGPDRCNPSRKSSLVANRFDTHESLSVMEL